MTTSWIENTEKGFIVKVGEVEHRVSRHDFTPNYRFELVVVTEGFTDLVEHLQYLTAEEVSVQLKLNQIELSALEVTQNTPPL